MRQAVWLILIAFSISALAGGFLSGRAAVPHFSPRAAPTYAPAAAALNALVPQTDDVADDAFAVDPAVAMRAEGGTLRQDARLALILVDAGHSLALETPFLHLGVPVTLVADPFGAAAASVGRVARSAGDSVYLQAQVPLSEAQVRRLHLAFPYASGVALRPLSAGALPAAALLALRDLHLGLLDEAATSRGAAARAEALGVRYARRGITVDDHSQRSYVSYMFAQAVYLARGGTVVVMARPFPGTFQALEDLLARASRDGIHFVELPQALGRLAVQARTRRGSTPRA